jgi:hypothetical protein
MKMLKKVTAVLVVLLLVLGTMSIGATAAGETGTIGITIAADKDQNLYPGDIVTFTVNISTDFNYIAMRWPVMYTLKAFEPVIGNDGNGDSDYGNVVGLDDAISDPNSYLESAEATTMEPFGDGYSKVNYGCLLVQWTGGTNGNSVICYNRPQGADCFTFQLRVKPGYTANGGVATVAIPTTEQASSLFYLQGITNPSNANTTYKMTTETCTITSEPKTVNIIKEAAGILPKGDTVIDTGITTFEGSTINYIYGLNSVVVDGEQFSTVSIQSYLTLTGNAKIELWTKEEIDQPDTYDPDPEVEKLISTGAKLKLFDASGRYLDEFTFVVFGDINGDGTIDGIDGTLLIEGYLYLYEWSFYDVNDNPMCFACDINADGSLGSDDYGPLIEAIGSKGYINQSHDDPANFFIYF